MKWPFGLVFLSAEDSGTENQQGEKDGEQEAIFQVQGGLG